MGTVRGHIIVDGLTVEGEHMIGGQTTRLLSAWIAGVLVWRARDPYFTDAIRDTYPDGST